MCVDDRCEKEILQLRFMLGIVHRMRSRHVSMAWEKWRDVYGMQLERLDGVRGEQPQEAAAAADEAAAAADEAAAAADEAALEALVSGACAKSAAAADDEAALEACTTERTEGATAANDAEDEARAMQRELCEMQERLLAMPRSEKQKRCELKEQIDMLDAEVNEGATRARRASQGNIGSPDLIDQRADAEAAAADELEAAEAGAMEADSEKLKVQKAKKKVKAKAQAGRKNEAEAALADAVASGDEEAIAAALAALADAQQAEGENQLNQPEVVIPTFDMSTTESPQVDDNLDDEVIMAALKQDLEDAVLMVQKSARGSSGRRRARALQALVSGTDDKSASKGTDVANGLRIELEHKRQQLVTLQESLLDTPKKERAALRQKCEAIDALIRELQDQLLVQLEEDLSRSAVKIQVTCTVLCSLLIRWLQALVRGVLARADCCTIAQERQVALLDKKYEMDVKILTSPKNTRKAQRTEMDELEEEIQRGATTSNRAMRRSGEWSRRSSSRGKRRLPFEPEAGDTDENLAAATAERREGATAANEAEDEAKAMQRELCEMQERLLAMPRSEKQKRCELKEQIDMLDAEVNEGATRARRASQGNIGSPDLIDQRADAEAASAIKAEAAKQLQAAADQRAEAEAARVIKAEAAKQAAEATRQATNEARKAENSEFTASCAAELDKMNSILESLKPGANNQRPKLPVSAELSTRWGLKEDESPSQLSHHINESVKERKYARVRNDHETASAFMDIACIMQSCNSISKEDLALYKSTISEMAT